MKNGMWYYILVFIASVALTYLIIWRLNKFRATDDYDQSTKPLIKFLRWEERLIRNLHKSTKGFFSGIEQRDLVWGIIIEILLIGAWAFWVGREYLTLDPAIIPTGREFSSAIQTHHVWTRFGECGLCALWNGSMRGGYPAFADIHGSMLHILVILTTTLFGVVNGAKISLVLSLWIGGLAQWWIGRELKLSRVSRLWTSAMAIVAGHLTGKMELGAFGVLLSMAMASLVFGGILAVARGKGNKGIVLLGIALASALLAGQGYIQVGLFSSFPAILILLLDHQFKLKDTWKEYVLALLLGLLLAAIFLVPFTHFYPNFYKFTDLDFRAAQPFKFIPLNFVIDSYDFYQSEDLGKMPFPHQYVLFIGWIPVLLAIFGLSSKKITRSTKWYFITSILIILGISSGDLLKLLAKAWEGISGIRHPTQIAGLTIPLILGFSGLGLDRLIDLSWPKLDLQFNEPSSIEFPPLPTQLLLVIPLIFSLHQGYQFSKHWISTYTLNDEIYEVVQELKTDTLQWVQTPFGEHFYIEPAIGEGLKLSPGIMTWSWKDRDFPEAYYEASHSGQPEDTEAAVGSVNSINIYSRPDAEYAIIKDGNEVTACQATGTGGTIQVKCNAPSNGRLIIHEYNWKGWKGWMDGKRVAVFGNPWISVEVPQGYHTYTFRYLPLDVLLGTILSASGILMAILIWLSPAPFKDKIFKNQKGVVVQEE